MTVTVTVADAVCVTVIAGHVPDDADPDANPVEDATDVLLADAVVVVDGTAWLSGIISYKLIRHAPPHIVCFVPSPLQAMVQPVAVVL